MKKLCNFPIINFDSFKLYSEKKKFFIISLKLIIRKFFNKKFLYKYLKRELFILKSLKLSNIKTRKSIKSSNRKIRNQKGTGKARMGPVSSPLNKGGGIIFGPSKCLLEQKINRKEKRLVIQYLLYVKKSNLLFLDSINFINKKVNINTFFFKLTQFGLLTNSRILLIVRNEKFKTILIKYLKNYYITIMCFNNIKSINIIISDYIIYFI